MSFESFLLLLILLALLGLLQRRNAPKLAMPGGGVIDVASLPRGYLHEALRAYVQNQNYLKLILGGLN